MSFDASFSICFRLLPRKNRVLELRLCPGAMAMSDNASLLGDSLGAFESKKLDVRHGK
jgi:hypothetical protein